MTWKLHLPVREGWDDSQRHRHSSDLCERIHDSPLRQRNDRNGRHKVARDIVDAGE